MIGDMTDKLLVLSTTTNKTPKYSVHSHSELNILGVLSDKAKQYIFN